MIDSVESLREIDSHRHSPAGGAFLVETCYHLLSKWQQGRDGGPAGAIAVLGLSQWQVRTDPSEHQFLKYFGGRAQNRDRTIGWTLVFRFTRFEDGDNNGVLPYCWEVGVPVGKVEEISEVSNSQWS